MYTVKEISEKIGVSKVTIYNDLKRFKSELKPYLRVEQRSKYLSEEGLDLLKKLRGGKTKLDSNLNQTLESELRQRLEDSEVQIKYLKSQIEISQKNFEREQQLHEHTQVLLKQSQDHSLLLEHQLDEKSSEEDHLTLWQKIFGSKKMNE